MSKKQSNSDVRPNGPIDYAASSSDRDEVAAEVMDRAQHGDDDDRVEALAQQVQLDGNKFGEVVAIVGTEAAAALFDKYRGTRFTVPTTGERSELGALIGDEPLQRLVHEMGGEKIRVPSQDAIDRRARRRQILNLVSQGVPKKDIAQRLGISLRSVIYTLDVA